jgi:hypothetical protein
MELVMALQGLLHLVMELQDYMKVEQVLQLQVNS